jgi:predicted DNA-binding transcriptional regulator AlpA
MKLEATPAIIAPEDLLTPAELAARLKVPLSWIWEQTRERAKDRTEHPLPVVRLSPKVIRFRWSEISDWIKSKQ